MVQDFRILIQGMDASYAYPCESKASMMTKKGKSGWFRQSEQCDSAFFFNDLILGNQLVTDLLALLRSIVPVVVAPFILAQVAFAQTDLFDVAVVRTSSSVKAPSEVNVSSSLAHSSRVSVFGGAVLLDSLHGSSSASAPLILAPADVIAARQRAQAAAAAKAARAKKRSSSSSAPIELPASSSSESSMSQSSSSSVLPVAENMDLRHVVEMSSSSAALEVEAAVLSSASESSPASNVEASISLSKFLLGKEVPPRTATRLTWIPDVIAGGFSEETPVLVINGSKPGMTLCLTGAVHGDELNGIEMIRRVMFGIDANKLTGAIIGVPVANIMGFRRNSRYLPDRRDWNRYFPGNTRGSSASRMAYSFFTEIIMQCDALVDIHTGSFHRTNLPQLRADLSNEAVATLAQSFGSIAVLNSRGNPNSLRAAAVRAGVPAVTLEAGEPMAMQSDVVEEGTTAINGLLSKLGMFGKQKRWNRISPVYYKSTWVRTNQSGILFSEATLGKKVSVGELLGTVTDPITNQRSDIISPFQGRILGMALDQVVMPGFAIYHIGIQTPEAILIEESQGNEANGEFEEDEEDGDDAGTPEDVQPGRNDLQEPITKPQDNLEDE